MSIYKERPKGEYRNYWLLDPDGKWYVGYCKGAVEDRWDNGRGYKNNPHLWAKINDCGWDNIKKGYLGASPEGIPVELAADTFEPWWIAHLDCMWPNGYNMNSGGRRGYHFCQETKDKMSAAHGKPVHQIDMETGVILYTWPNIKAAAQATGINRTSIWKAVHGYRKKAGGFYWQLAEETQTAGEIPPFSYIQ